MPAKRPTTPSDNPLPPRKRSPVQEPPPVEADPRYTVIRDTREKEGQGWEFAASTACAGTTRRVLKTGDYTLEGFEDLFTIDRKGAVSEFATNVFDERFARELERMKTFKMAIILLEFSFQDMMDYPKGSSVPRSRWKYIRAKGPTLLKRYWQLQLAYPHVHFLFAGDAGKEAASSLFKRVIENAQP